MSVGIVRWLVVHSHLDGKCCKSKGNASSIELESWSRAYVRALVVKVRGWGGHARIGMIATDLHTISRPALCCANFLSKSAVFSTLWSSNDTYSDVLLE